MSEMGEQRGTSNLFLILLIVAVALGLGSLVWCFGLQNHVGVAEQRLQDAQKDNAELRARLDATNARLKATTETLGQSLGMTQKQLEAKSDSILARQQADSARLEKTEAAQAEKINAVNADVANVKTDVGGVKTDVAATKTDLETTKSNMNRMMGDEGKMSGLIATNHDELEELKRKGERNYFEFTLHKGEKPVIVSTVTLQLKKVDAKKGKFTMVVNSDDRNIEKKDKNVDEPVQFYTGKSPVQLYEIVVNSMDKNVISGYLATPK